MIRLRRSWAAPLALIAVTTVVAVAVAGFGAAGEVPRLVLGLVSSAAVLMGVRRFHPRPASAWRLIALGIALWAVGDAVWTWADTADSGSLGRLADGLYLPGYLAIGAGIFQLTHARGGRASREGLLDGGIFAIAAVILVWITLVAPQSSDGSWVTYDVASLAAYPIGDGLLLAGIMWLALTPGRRTASLWLLSGGLTLTFAADVLWDVGARLDGDWGPWLTPCYPIAYAMIAAAALHPSMRDISLRTQASMPRVHPARLLLLGTAIFVGPVATLAGRGSDGEYDPLVITGALLVALLVVIRFVVALRESERARARAAASEERFRAVAEGTPVGIYEADIDLTVVYANPESEHLFGRDIEGRPARELLDAVDHRDRNAARNVVADVTDGRRTTAELRLRIMGEERWVSWTAAPVHDRDGGVSGVLSSTVDITATKRAEEALARQATHDALTGLPNRRLFFEQLKTAFATHARRHTTLAVLFLDLDGFKAVNDSFGHEAGDALLVAIAERLRHTMREGDTIARFGGDEFVALFADAGSPDLVEAAASRLLAAVKSPVDLEQGDKAVVTASVGVAFSDGTGDADDLVRQADAAMYEAKEKGRDRVVRSSGSTGDRVTSA
ncbi:MAG: diguanylate cyclase domain-containing protein [Acidimicrobiia bacterium]